MYKLTRLSKSNLRKLSEKEIIKLLDNVNRYQEDVESEYYRKQSVEIRKRMKEYYREQKIESKNTLKTKSITMP